nr:uncharacterized protein LOC109160681 isoform X2 [Ipomoea batatas]
MVGCLMVSRGLSPWPLLPQEQSTGRLSKIGSALNHVCNPLKPTVLVLQQGVLDLQGFYCGAMRCGGGLKLILVLSPLTGIISPKPAVRIRSWDFTGFGEVEDEEEDEMNNTKEQRS